MAFSDVTLKSVEIFISILQNVSLLLESFQVLVCQDELLLGIHVVLLLNYRFYFLAFLDVLV